MSFQKIWCSRTAAFQKIRTAEGGSIAPNFAKGVVSEKLVLSNRGVSENQHSEGRFDSTKFSEGCCFRKFDTIEPLRVQKIKTTKSGSIGPNFRKGVVSENLVLSNRSAFIGFV